MSTKVFPRLQVGNFLPALDLPAAPDGRRESLQAPSRDALVLVLLPRQFGPWRVWLDTLARAAEEIEQWYARVRVVIAAELEVATQAHTDHHGKLRVLADVGGAARGRIGIAAGNAGLVIADRYGQVYEVNEVSAEVVLPSPGEIEEWVKFLATQCPECGVIDEPGYGEWALS